MIQHIFRKYPLERVFTPSTTAELAFVPRSQIQDDLTKSLRIPGKQIVLYGHSGGGKTTLLTKTLDLIKQYSISSSCTIETTVDQLIIGAFDQLNAYYLESVTNSQSRAIERSISKSLKAKFIEISNSVKESYSNTTTSSKKKAVPLQLTAQRLAEFIGAAGALWIIEDFHKVVETEKKKLSQILKVFMDTAQHYPLVRIVCVGAVGTARELLAYDPELSNRISEIQVPLFNISELNQLVERGSQLINIQLPNDIKEKIVYYSNHLAAVCHQLCYDMCYNNGVTHTRIFRVNMNNKDFNGAVASYVKSHSDTFDKILDKAFRQRAGRYENSKVILRAFVESEQENLTSNEIFAAITKVHSKYPRSNLSAYLKLLTKSEFFEVLRYDRNAGKYTFSNPFLSAYAKMKFALDHHKSKKQDFSLSHDKSWNNAEFLELYMRLLEDQRSERQMITESQRNGAG